MDDIAGKIPQGNIYVYFEDKEESVGILVLNSMKKLYDYISSALLQQETTIARTEKSLDIVKWGRQHQLNPPAFPI